MNPLSNDSIPQICSEVGLTCESCTAETARHLAAVCKGLPGKMIAQLFVQIYPNSACAPMHRRFAAHYQEASAALAETVAALVEEPLPQRLQVRSARPRTVAAVA
jgi:methionine synthase I (cobalamin-dependent)